MSATLPKNIPLTGSDCFIHTLETHDQFTGTSGNTCRYIIELEGTLDVQAFEKKLNNNAVFKWLSTFYLAKKPFLKNPKWNNAVEKPVIVNEIASGEFIPREVSQRKFNIARPPLFAFDIIKRKENRATVIYSWHHLLMDGYGAALSLRYLLQNISPDPAKAEKFSPGLSSFWQAVRAKFFIQGTGSGKLAGITANTQEKAVTQQLKIISLSEEETQKMEQSAKNSGARFGTSPYYLVCCARAVKSVLMSRGQEMKGDFWIPVPQDERKKGSRWPVVGNHLSFLFYRVSSASLNSIKTAVEAVNAQMVNQIKKGIPEAYNSLIKYLRRTPTPLYYYWIKGPKGNSLSSFLFTVAAEHPKDLQEFEGLSIKNVISLPPNTYPPGLTFAFMKFRNKLQLAILYYDQAVNLQEIAMIESQIRHELINGEPEK